MRNPSITLVTGGSRSGKSRWALERMSVYPRKIFLATGVAMDPEMQARIAQHQKERGKEFTTIEEPVFLAKVIREQASRGDAILVDCLTLWLNNLLHYFGDGEVLGSPRTSKEIQDFLKVLEERPTALVIVTNEVSMGVVPLEALSRRFVDQQGWLNQEVARRADEVVLMVSGIPQALKQEPARVMNGKLV